MHIGTKVGEFSWIKRHRLSPTLEVEATYEGDILAEHKITQKVREEVEANFKRFSEKYGVSTGATESPNKRGRKSKDEASELLATYQDHIFKAIGTEQIQLSLEAPQRRQEIRSTKTVDLDREVADALVHLNSLKAYLGAESSVGKITEADLRNSRALRTSVAEYKGFYFFQSPNTPKSFEKKYDSYEQKKTDFIQSYDQSYTKQDLERAK